MKNLYRLLCWVLFGTLLFTGCSAQRWCEKHYPSVVSDSTYTKTDTIIKWDTVKVPEISIVFDTTFDFIPRGLVFDHKEKRGGLTSGFSIKNGKIKTLCLADSLELVIKNLQEKTATFHQKKETKWLPCDREHKTNFNYFATYWFWITLLLIIIAIVIKCFRG